MASFQKTFRKSGSHHAEFHSLQGVEVKIGEKFRPPKKVTLPVGWQQKDPSAALSLVYDFSLEKEVVAKAEALRASKQEETEVSSTESQAAKTSVEATSIPVTKNSVFSNVGSEILQPVVAPGRGHKKNDSFGGKGKNAFDISDFEGDTSTPFELVELQTINDMDELKNVLQPNAVSTTAIENSSSSCDSKPSIPLANTTAGSINLPANSLSSSQNNSLVDISGLSVVDRPSAPIRGLPGQTNVPATNAITEASALLVDIGESRTSRLTTPAPGTVPGSNGLIHSNPLPNASLNVESRPVSSGGPLPPIGQSFPSSPPPQSQGHQSFPIPTLSSASRNSFLGGICSFPSGVSPPQGQHLKTEERESGAQNRQYSPPSYVSCLRDQQWNTLSSTDYQNVGGRFPSPLPPIGMSYEEPRNKQSASYQSSLPDPWPVLSDTEKSFANKFVGMGFPTPRVARAVQRLGPKDKEVIEFLVNVDDLCENKTYSADSVEVALVFNPEKAKAVEFLELVKTFKEYGFKEENIHECLRAADNDQEKALEYLMTLSST